MDFILGCNYWASNAGIEMWQCFEPEAIEKDISTLAAHGIKYLRVFPLWRDFQPITPVISAQGEISEYAQNGKEPENEYFLDGIMLSRFSTFLDICDRYGVKLIVGLITGWMSGGLFAPVALNGKNLITDPLAQYFEQLFIKGFVSRFKDRETVYAWDLGNECNGMSPISSRFEAASWTAMISNAIKAADSTRPVVSGMHGLSMTEKWTIRDQGAFTDMLTTHPYPLWCEHTRIDKTLSFRTTLLPTAQGKYYSDIGARPCLAEEFGTMGNMICSDEVSADFLRVNLFSLWANGSEGVMWWCNSDQTLLESFPYTHQMVERELGLIKESGEIKPQLKEFKKFDEFLKKTGITLPKYESDAVCVLTRHMRHWGVAYTTYLLARRAGLNISFAYGDDALPDSPLYLLPSVSGATVLPKAKYDALKKKVYEGSDLYISYGEAILSGFEELVGLKVIDSYDHTKECFFDLDGERATFTRTRNIITEPTTAKVLRRDGEGNPLISVNNYGKGHVYFVNAPIEDELIDTHDFTASPLSNLYRFVFKEKIGSLPLKISDSELLTTLHKATGYAYVTVINHTKEKREFALTLEGYEITEVIYGDKNLINPYDACVFKLTKK